LPSDVVLSLALPSDVVLSLALPFDVVLSLALPPDVVLSLDCCCAKAAAPKVVSPKAATAQNVLATVCLDMLILLCDLKTPEPV